MAELAEYFWSVVWGISHLVQLLFMGVAGWSVCDGNSLVGPGGFLSHLSVVLVLRMEDIGDNRTVGTDERKTDKRTNER
jgi:hypothetical protein